MNSFAAPFWHSDYDGNFALGADSLGRDVWPRLLHGARIALVVADVARQSLRAVEDGVEDIYVGDMAQGTMQSLRVDEKAIEKQLAGMLPM